MKILPGPTRLPNPPPLEVALLTRRVIVNKKKQLLVFATTIVVMVAIFFAVLNYFLALQRPPTSSTELTVGSLRYSLEMPRTHFGDGEDVTVRMTIKNVGSQEIKLSFASQLEFDLIVQRDINLIFATVPLNIWIYSACHPNQLKAHVLVLKPQQTHSFVASWPQVDAHGDKVSPGRYLLTGVLNTEGSRQSLQLRGSR